MAKEWLPHEYVPWSLGRDLAVEPWSPEQPLLTGVAQAAFEVNLLTEDNLPSYHHQLLASFGRDGAWRTWSHRWTAREGRHEPAWTERACGWWSAHASTVRPDSSPCG